MTKLKYYVTINAIQINEKIDINNASEDFILN